MKEQETCWKDLLKNKVLISVCSLAFFNGCCIHSTELLKMLEEDWTLEFEDIGIVHNKLTHSKWGGHFKISSALNDLTKPKLSDMKLDRTTYIDLHCFSHLVISISKCLSRRHDACRHRFGNHWSRLS